MCFSTVKLEINGNTVFAGSKGRVIGPSSSHERVVVEFEDGSRCNVLAKTEIDTPEQGHLRFMSSEYQPTEDGVCMKLLWNVSVCMCVSRGAQVCNGTGDGSGGRWASVLDRIRGSQGIMQHCGSE